MEHPAAEWSRCPAPSPTVDGYRIPREEYALRAIRGSPPSGAPPGRLGRAGRGSSGHRGSPQVGAWSPTGPVTWGSRRPAPGGPQPGAAVRRRGQPESGAPAPRDEERTVDPYRLEFQRGRWYLTGFDHLRGRSGTTGSTASTARWPSWTARRSSPPRPSPDKPAARGSVPSRRSAPGAHRRTPGELGGAARRSRPRGAGGLGWLRRRAPVTNRAAFRSFVLSFLEHAEILDPPEPARRPGGVALVTVSNASAARMQRLAMVPWIAAQDGPTLVDVCERFGLTEGARR